MSPRRQEHDEKEKRTQGVHVASLTFGVARGTIPTRLLPRTRTNASSHAHTHPYGHTRTHKHTPPRTQQMYDEKEKRTRGVHVASLAFGFAHAVAVLETGDAYMWGLNLNSQLGVLH